jgi:hypothetical protein
MIEKEMNRNCVFQFAVIRISEALKQRGVKVNAEELKNQVALETEAKELIPILPDCADVPFIRMKD